MVRIAAISYVSVTVVVFALFSEEKMLKENTELFSRIEAQVMEKIREKLGLNAEEENSEEIKNSENNNDSNDSNNSNETED